MRWLNSEINKSGAKSEVAESSPISGFKRNITRAVVCSSPAMSLIRDASRGLSMTIRTPKAMALRMIASSLIDPLSEILDGGTFARSAPSNSPGPNTSQPQSSSDNSALMPSIGQALSEGMSSKRGHSAPKAARNSRTRSRIASPENTKSGVPNWRAIASKS